MEIIASLQNIGFDWQLALAHVVNFLIVFALLKYFVFDSLEETLEARRNRIQEGLDKASKASAKKEEAQEVYDQKVADAKSEAQLILKSAQEQADKIVEEAQYEAKNEAERIIEDARDQISQEKARMEKEIEDKAANLAVDGARRILENATDKKVNEEIVNNYL